MGAWQDRFTDLTIIEMAGLGPGPFAAMMLADHGAEVIRVERAGMIGVANDPLLRNRRSISLDLKRDDARDVVRRLAAKADGLIEGYRPGVMERLGLGPDALIGANPKLVYGRVTGWGQDGPLSAEAGHDINYLALTGLLHGIGPKERPVVPINYIGDYAGGGMMLAFGMVAALLDVQRGGAGQVIDAAMSDGAALIGALTYGLKAAGAWRDEREANLLDGGDPTYGVYRCADGKFCQRRGDRAAISRKPVQGAGLGAGFDPRADRAVSSRRAARDEWATHFARTDACVAPVLDLDEAPVHPHNIARRTFIDLDGVFQPAPAPRYSETLLDRPLPPRREGADGAAILGELGYGAGEIADILEGTIEPALRADADERVRADEPCRGQAWCGQPRAGVSRLRLARPKSSTRRRERCAMGRTNMRRRAGCRRCAKRWPTIIAAITDSTSRPRMSASPAARPRRWPRRSSRLVEPGDEVIVMTPAYDAYAPLIRRAGGVVREVALQPPGWRIERAAIEAAVSPQTRAIVLNNPHNPTGRLFDADELAAVADVARAHDLIVIADEVWEHVLLDGQQFVPFAALPGMAARTLKCGSAGKIFSLTGWKIGWLVAPPELATLAARAHQFLTFASAPNLQAAVAFGLAEGDDWIEPMRGRLRPRARPNDRGARSGGLRRAAERVDLFPVRRPRRVGNRARRRELRQAGGRASRGGGDPLVAVRRGRSAAPPVRLCFAKRDETIDAGVAAMARARAAAQLRRARARGAISVGQRFLHSAIHGLSASGSSGRAMR